MGQPEHDENNPRTEDGTRPDPRGPRPLEDRPAAGEFTPGWRDAAMRIVQDLAEQYDEAYDKGQGCQGAYDGGTVASREECDCLPCLVLRAHRLVGESNAHG